jgi:predicted dehydrogenase
MRVAIVGCGAVTQFYYAPALRELEEQGVVRVVSLFDPQTASAGRVQAEFPAASIMPHIDAIAPTGADLAIVASPARFHAAQAIQLLSAGVSVLCEKPMASSVAEGERMAEVARATDRTLAIGLVRRFFPAAQWIRTAIASGVLGDLISVSVYEGYSMPWPVVSTDHFKRSVSGGGVFQDIGIHALDLLSWWLGEPTSVAYEDDAMGGLDVNCRVKLGFENGLAADLRLSREWEQPNHYTFRGTRGWLHWVVNEADGVLLGLHGSPYVLDGNLHTGSVSNGRRVTLLAPDFHRSFVSQLRNVVAAVQDREEVFITAAEGLRSLRLMERCYASRTLMLMPWLSEEERRHASILGG